MGVMSYMFGAVNKNGAEVSRDSNFDEREKSSGYRKKTISTNRSSLLSIVSGVVNRLKDLVDCGRGEMTDITVTASKSIFGKLGSESPFDVEITIPVPIPDNGHGAFRHAIEKSFEAARICTAIEVTIRSRTKIMAVGRYNKGLRIQ